MTTIRKQVMDYINHIPDAKLEALRPLLMMLSDDDDFAVQTDLTDEEKNIIQQGREEYKEGNFISLDSI